MGDTLVIRIDGREVRVRPGTTVASAVLNAGVFATRRSFTGEPRGPVCGMGVCFECRVTIDGEPYHLACQTPCSEGMEVTTDGR
jgi:D-hydroxyproline dehydrogenase subunit gamma